MRRVLLLAVTLFWAVALHAQSPSPITVATVRTTAGQTRWSVTNTGTATVTAFAYTHRLGTPLGSHIASVTATTVYDAATEPRAVPIPSGQTITLQYGPGAGEPGDTPQVRAILFANGASWGESIWSARMMRLRSYLETALTTSIGELAQALQAGTGGAQIIGQFQAATASEQNAVADSDERSCINSVRGLVLRNLQSAVQTSAGAPERVTMAVRNQYGSMLQRLAALQGVNGGR